MRFEILDYAVSYRYDNYLIYYRRFNFVYVLLTQILCLGLLGGNGDDYVTPFAIEEDNYLYLSGSTTSPDFPMATSSYQGDLDGVLVKMKEDGSELLESRLVGGNGFEWVRGALASQGVVYGGGETSSATLPVLSTAYDSTYNGETDIFLAQVNFAADCPLVEIVSARYLNANTIGVVGFVRPDLIGTGQATLAVGNSQVDLDELAFNNAPSGAANAQGAATHDANERRLRGYWSTTLVTTAATSLTLVARANTAGVYQPNITSDTNCQETLTMPTLTTSQVQLTNIVALGTNPQANGVRISGRYTTATASQLVLEHFEPITTNLAMRPRWVQVGSQSVSGSNSWSIATTTAITPGENLYRVRLSNSNQTVQTEDIDGFYAKPATEMFMRRPYDINTDMKNRGQALTFRDAARNTIATFNQTANQASKGFTEQLFVAMGAQETGGAPSHFDNGYPITVMLTATQTEVVTDGIMQVTKASGYKGATECGGNTTCLSNYNYQRTRSSIYYNVEDSLDVLDGFYAQVPARPTTNTITTTVNGQQVIDRLVTSLVYYNATYNFVQHYVDAQQTNYAEKKYYLRNVARQLNKGEANSLPQNLSLAEFLGDADYTAQSTDLPQRLRHGQQEVCKKLTARGVTCEP